MLPWIATTLFLIVLSGFVPAPLADTMRLFAIGYGLLTLCVVLPIWTAIRLARIMTRPLPAPVEVIG